MNQLPESKRAQILSCLTEGMAVRATARVTGVSNGAVLRLIAELGPACEAFHHRFVHDVNCKRVELDELHQFVYGKTRCLPPELKDKEGYGTVWTWLAISDARLIVSYLVGSRGLDACKQFVGDLAYRVRGKVQITSDAWGTYPAAIIEHFRAPLVDFGTVEKEFFGNDDSKRPEARYAPGEIRRVVKKSVLGDPDPKFMTTSHCERLNLTVRMQNKRYARLTNAHSKSIVYHRWALAIQVVFYNWCRPNAGAKPGMKMTPAQASGLTEFRFTVKDLLRLKMWGGEMLQDAI
jgi:IS1 family transposase